MHKGNLEESQGMQKSKNGQGLGGAETERERGKVQRASFEASYPPHRLLSPGSQ